MSEAQTPGGAMNRRRYLQLVGAATATAAVGSRLSIGQAEAGIWDTATDAAKATGAGLYLMTPVGQGDYFLTDDYGVFQDDYQVAEAQMDAAIRTSIAMRDGDDRALSMAWNQLENARAVAWIEAEAAAIEPMRNGKSESEVMAAAKDAAAEYLSGTVESNILNHWNAQVTKVEDILARMEEHADITADPSGRNRDGSQTNYAICISDLAYTHGLSSGTSFEMVHEIKVTEKDHQMLDGSTKTVKRLTVNGDDLDSYNNRPHLSPVDTFLPIYQVTGTNNDADYQGGHDTDVVLSNTTTGASSIWLDFRRSDPTTWSGQTAESNGVAWKDQQTLNKWLIVMDRMQTIYDDVIANVEQWASEAYSALQAGEVDMTDVITPTAMASEMNTRYDETGHLAYAAAGLAALNLSVDYENMMTFELSDGSTFQGTLFVDGAFEWSVGETISPSNVDGAIYAAVDTSTYRREFTSTDHFRAGIDGGEAVVYIEPIDQAIYTIATNRDETATVEGTAWEQTNPDAQPEIGEGETDWTTDLSADLEQQVAEIESVTVTFGDDVQSDTIELTEPFQIAEAYNVESGESVDTVSGDGGEENYNTVDASELEQALKQHREYLDEAGAFESDDAPGGGGGGGVDLGLGDGGILDWLTDTTMGIPNWAIVLTGGGALLLASR